MFNTHPQCPQATLSDINTTIDVWPPQPQGQSITPGCDKKPYGQYMAACHRRQLYLFPLLSHDFVIISSIALVRALDALYSILKLFT